MESRSGSGSPTIASARARETLDLAMSCAPSAYQRAKSERPSLSAPVTKVISTTKARSPIMEEAVRQAWSRSRAASLLRFPASSNRKAEGPSCM